MSEKFLSGTINKQKQTIDSLFVLEGDNDSDDESDIFFFSSLSKPKPVLISTKFIAHLDQTDDDQNKSGLCMETERRHLEES